MMGIKRIHIDPSWSFSDEAGNQVDPQLFRLLNEIHQHRKLTAAAKAIGISYRHAWNLLKKWSGFFGAEVVVLAKGRGAQLTPFGEKLLWAEQRVMARLKPQMDNLASEINLELHRAMADVAPLLKVHASHGYAVALLPEFAEQFQLDLQYQSPLEALAALNRGACDLAGIHVPNNVAIPALMDAYQREIKSHLAIGFVSREQGLIVRKGNPKGIQGLNDLLQPSVKFINREHESGTRSIFDQLLKNNGIEYDLIQGYRDQEFTHGAIAAYVAAGMADVGFGVKAAAKQFDLDFIPMAVEDYIFLCQKQKLNDASVQQFITPIRTGKFRQAIEQLPGYSSKGCGDISPAIELLS
jgi:molybdate transport repressor ModE-like protein